MLCTEVSYLYRDASNYKTRGRFVCKGRLSMDDIRHHLFDSEFFIPGKLGLPSLAPDRPGRDDHLLHEIEELQPVEQDRYDLPAEDFVALAAAACAEGWFR